MTLHNRIRMVAVGLAALSSASCASASNPWRSHDRTSDYKAMTADLERVCPVVVNNDTGQVLEAQVDLDGVDRNLGLLAAGQSVTVQVQCRARRVSALAVAHDPGPSEGTRFRKSAVLDVLKETRLQFTRADRVRW
jgi:hypothetical protein